ncbi:3-oxoacyl-[acyl-carrier-protein] synthase III C-terminal domain-containing protein [Kitasatospora terrestris]|uniref:Type III polyketide synthase n=1 Tax=Kitasatospora terrestris TaxID=258051 RepID=A0ABP9EPQ9_9ACTN
MVVYIGRPAVELPGHVVPRRRIAEDVERRHADHPRLASVRRVLGRMPAQRRYSQPFETVLADRDATERNATAFADVCRMGTAAARRALAAHHLSPADVDCVVTSHSTGDAVPGLDVHLVAELGLRPDVARRPMTQLGCAGGAHALITAVDHVRAHPGTTVLVVVAESLSSTYHHGDTDLEMMIYKALWGDSGAALLVSDRPLGPGLAVADTWEYLLPGSALRYRKRTDAAGVHFDSERSAPRSVAEASPALRDWLARPLPDGGPATGPWPLDFVVAHTGGPALLTDLADRLGLDDEQLSHSWSSLDEVGNLGGASVLDVLARTHTAPPPPGAHGLLLGFGPGFAVSALKTTWVA